MHLFWKPVATLAAVMLSFVYSVPASATSTTYIWHQTGQTMPGLVVDAYYTVIDGQPFPTIDNQIDAAPYDFGGLTAFYMYSNGALGGVDLSLLEPPCDPSAGCPNLSGYPIWNLSPGSLVFTSFIDSYNYFWNDTEIQIFSDYSDCGGNGVSCVVTGYFAPAPEPTTIVTFGAGLTLVAMRKRKKRPIRS